MDTGSPNLVVPPTDTTNDILDLTIEANLIVSGGADANAYELRNELLLQRRLARVRYDNGVTLPARAKNFVPTRTAR